MRKVNDLSDVQIVLNDLLNFKARIEGGHLPSIGNATLDNQAVTLAQVKKLIQNAVAPKTVPPVVAPPPEVGGGIGVYTIVWSTAGVVQSNDILPFFCVSNVERAGEPIGVWVICRTPNTDVINLQISLNNVIGSLWSSDSTVDLLANPLSLEENQDTMEASGFFVSPVPSIGVGARIAPRIIHAGSQSAVSIGLVVKTNAQ
jgi:hypothetical protein